MICFLLKTNLYCSSLIAFVTGVYNRYLSTRFKMKKSLKQNVICSLLLNLSLDLAQTDRNSFVFYFKDSLYDLFLLITNSNYKCLIDVDKIFNRPQFYTTTLTCKNLKKYRRISKDYSSFIGPIFCTHPVKLRFLLIFLKP